MAKKVMGFDFGTTNSTIGIATEDNIELMKLGNEKIETRTAVYYDCNRDKYTSGDDAILEFRKQPKGRLFQSLKSSLNNKNEIETLLAPGKKIKLTKVIEIIVKQFKNKIENILQEEIDSVAIGRPVKFHDTDKELDQLAEERLESVLKNVGFKNINFEYEPNAALKSYLNGKKKNGNVLVVDIGGGTSDFSIVNIENGNAHILGNDGIYIGGNKLDYVLSNNYFAKYLGKDTTYNAYHKILEVPPIHYSIISDWKNMHNIGQYKSINTIKGYYAFSNDKEKYERLLEIAMNIKKGYKYLDMVESVKKDLSYQNNISGKTDYFDDNFDYLVTRGDLNDTINDEIIKIIGCINNTILNAGIRKNEIKDVFLTGGTSLIPIIQQEIIKTLGINPKIIRGDIFNSVGYGLTKIAQERFL